MVWPAEGGGATVSVVGTIGVDITRVAITLSKSRVTLVVPSGLLVADWTSSGSLGMVTTWVPPPGAVTVTDVPVPVPCAEYVGSPGIGLVAPPSGSEYPVTLKCPRESVC